MWFGFAYLLGLNIFLRGNFVGRVHVSSPTRGSMCEASNICLFIRRIFWVCCGDEPVAEVIVNFRSSDSCNLIILECIYESLQKHKV